jgi:hypothetical protein
MNAAQTNSLKRAKEGNSYFNFMAQPRVSAIKRRGCILFGYCFDKPGLANYNGRAPLCSKYLWAFPSIHIVKENLKFGYEIAQVLLKIPSMASCAHEPS